MLCLESVQSLLRVSIELDPPKPAFHRAEVKFTKGKHTFLAGDVYTHQARGIIVGIPPRFAEPYTEYLLYPTDWYRIGSYHSIELTTSTY